MKSLFENALIKKIANIPVVWNAAQSLIGANQWKAQLYPSVFKQKGGTLLDFGCSGGNVTAMFLGFDYFGVDVDRQAIQAARNKFKQYPNVKFFDLDIIKDGFKKNFFDHILFAGTAHHVTNDELRKIIEILMENLKIGGQLHFFDSVTQTKDNWMTRFIIRSDQGKNVRTEAAYESFFSPDKYIINEWRVCPSPDRFIKFPDFLYINITK